ncbi:uncharacterized protein [Parasteatoda tepidariorum]|uniref:uncharacterized protein n=1 Tax=Parasteatoda tepidariorum TaxID=114398 RepID=UPI00077FCBD5|nr:uncharacterized protein LOC107442347 [Parasteatoda tepidariorum]
MFFWTVLCSYILIASAKEINMEAVMKSIQSFCEKMEEHGESMRSDMNKCFSLNPKNIQDILLRCYTKTIPGVEDDFSFFQEACKDHTTKFPELFECYGENKDILQNTNRTDALDCEIAMSKNYDLDMFVPMDEEPKSE